MSELDDELVLFFRANMEYERNKPLRPPIEVTTDVIQTHAPKRRRRPPPPQPDFTSGRALVGVIINSINPTHGPSSGGQTITIYGVGFRTGLTVTFDGVAQTLTPGSVASDGTNILFFSVAGTAGQVDVKVTNPGGAFATLVKGYTYDGGPVITSISPTSGLTVGGTLVTVTGTGFVNGAGLTLYFGSSAATQVSASGTTTIYGYTPAHVAGPVNVKVTNPDGQHNELVNGYTYLSTIPDSFTVVPDSVIAPFATNIVITAKLNGTTLTSFNETCSLSVQPNPFATASVNPSPITFTSGVSNFTIAVSPINQSVSGGSIEILVIGPDFVRSVYIFWSLS